MTPNQEEALYNFLENAIKPFTLEEVTGYVRMQDSMWAKNLPQEIVAHIDSRKIAFRLDNRNWLSRRGFFENIPFVISPSRLELINGILIPGHRCIPFANPAVMPHDYEFFWQNKKIPKTTSEGHPADFYPYYSMFGEEFAPQYIARDNIENESAFNFDPYEEPHEVSINTFDMRSIFRETAFIPGDRFVVHSRDWKEGHFDLEKVNKDQWSQEDLLSWFEAAQKGFEDSFSKLGPGICTEEQTAFAYWYGGKRMCEIPAYSLEEFIHEKTDLIEMVPYGIETRFWYAGKDIPDSNGLIGINAPPDRTFIEDVLFKVNIPVSEYVVLSYIRDAIYRKEIDVEKIIDNIVPSTVQLGKSDREIFAGYIAEALEEKTVKFSLSFDNSIGPVRQRAGELHKAVVDLAARLKKGELDPSWLPRHTFISLSQIQGYTANLLEDLDSDSALPDSEIEAMENSIDTMIDAFDEQKDIINEAMNNFRRSNMTVIRKGKDSSLEKNWLTVQISIGGTDIWRRVVIPVNWILEDLHRLIQVCLNWKNEYRHRFFAGKSVNIDKKELDNKLKIREIGDQGIVELEYEYGSKWTIKAILFSHQAGKDETVRCVAGEGAAPPESINGNVRFNKILRALNGGSASERQAALLEVGKDFDPMHFDIGKCNRDLAAAFKAVK